jgi:hypothetical protein
MQTAKVNPNSPAGVILASGIFDLEFYSVQANQSFASIVSAVEHYLDEGWRKGLEPHPLFSSRYYIQSYPDVAQTNVNPLQHYIAHGGFEGRNPSLYFDSAYYRAQYKDVAESKINPLVHYIRHGGAEGRNPSSWFDSAFYVATYDDVASSGLNPLVHYVLIGKAGGRRTNCRQLIAPEIYMPMREYEPLLPSYDSLVMLRQVNECVASQAGHAYRKLQALLTEPFSHLLLLPERSNEESATCADLFIQQTVKQLGAKSVLVALTEGNASDAVETSSVGVRFVTLNSLSGQLSENDKLSIVCRLALQAKPKVIHLINSTVGWLLFRKYSRQLLLSSKLTASLISYERDGENIPTGFSLLLGPCLESLHAVFVPSQLIADEFIAQAGLPPRLAQRFVLCDSETDTYESLRKIGYLPSR